MKDCYIQPPSNFPKLCTVSNMLESPDTGALPKEVTVIIKPIVMGSDSKYSKGGIKRIAAVVSIYIKI